MNFFFSSLFLLVRTPKNPSSPILAINPFLYCDLNVLLYKYGASLMFAIHILFLGSSYTKPKDLPCIKACLNQDRTCYEHIFPMSNHFKKA